MANNPPNTMVRTSHAMAIRVKGITTGTLQTFNPSQSRTITPVYEINRDTSGEPVDNSPGNVTGLTLSVTRYDIYTRRMEEAFGLAWNLEMLSDQSDPFEVREGWRFPDNSVEARVYVGSWFGSLGRTYSATGDRLVMVNASITYLKILRIQ